MNDSHKTCFITGGNSGIGKEAAIQLAKLKHKVLIGARNAERGNQAVADIRKQSSSKDVHLVLVDMADQESIKSAADHIKASCPSLDVLIHNAADFNIAQKETKQSPQGIETLWATNHIGPVLLTDLLLDLLKKSKQGRILTVASEGLKLFPFLKIKWDDIEFQSRKFSVTKAYYQSKLAQVMYTYWLAEKLAKTKITVNCIRVTNVKIDMDRYPEVSAFMKSIYKLKSSFSISPKEMAKTYTYLSTNEEVAELSGCYFNEKNEQVTSNSWSRKQEKIKQLMKTTYTYIN